MLNIILLGAPGSGKGTQADYIIRRYGLKHLSSGDVFRKAIADKTDLGLSVKHFLDKGELVPDNIVLKEIYRNALLFKKTAGIIFDGFPRTQKQGEMLDQLLKKRKLPISLVVSLEVPEEELYKRMLLRAKIQNRSDDTEEIIKNRMTLYRAETEPLKTYYKEKHKLIEVDGFREVVAVAGSIAQGIDIFIKENNINLNHSEDGDVEFC